MAITMEEAQRAINASLAKANELGVKVGIVVIDEPDDVVASVRMTGARFRFLFEAARGKALATLIWGGQPSGSLVERGGTPFMQMVSGLYNGKLAYQPGAVAIKKGETVVGAIGVGGASAQQDEEIAKAGAAAIQ